METNPPARALLNGKSGDLGPVTRGMLRERAIELAAGGGRTAQQVSKADWDQARRESSGAPEVDPKDAILEAAPESERWDPVPGSPGHQAPESPAEGEDAEGRNESAQLVDEGINEAERDQISQSTKELKADSAEG
jgi:hypothetical protein